MEDEVKISMDAIVIATATVLATVIGVLLQRYLTRKGREYKWRRISSKDVPLWVVHEVYQKRYPNKQTIAKDFFHLRGSIFEYQVRFKGRNSSADEPNARVRHMTVLRRRMKGK